MLYNSKVFVTRDRAQSLLKSWLMCVCVKVCLLCRFHGSLPMRQYHTLILQHTPRLGLPEGSGQITEECVVSGGIVHYSWD